MKKHTKKAKLKLKSKRKKVFALALVLILVSGLVLYAYNNYRARTSRADAQYQFVPIAGDFNGDQKEDILWYGRGQLPDYLWSGTAEAGRYDKTNIKVDGSYLYVVGDFDGNGVDDIFWSGTSGSSDEQWYGTRNGTFQKAHKQAKGDFFPFAGDFDGDGFDDVFWYNKGKKNDVIWYGESNREWRQTRKSVEGSYIPIPGDFDGDRKTDIFWYGKGNKRDHLWYSTGQQDRFATKTIDVAGNYTAIPGDFDGDGVDDIFWYGTGNANDSQWFGTRSQSWDRKDADIGGNYSPVAGDFNGNGRDEIFWYAQGDAPDWLWTYKRDRSFTYARVFDPSRPFPFQPVNHKSAYNPYGYIAHAFGSINGDGYTNSLEAFEHNYQKGFRVFEVDFVKFKDGSIWAVHDGTERDYGLSKSFKDSTHADMNGKKFKGRYTVLGATDVINLMRSHPDIYIIADLKDYLGDSVNDRPVIYSGLAQRANKAPAIMDRLIPHVGTQAELDSVRNVYQGAPHMLALYITQYDDRLAMTNAQAVEFIKRNKTPAVMMWHGTVNSSLSLAENLRQQRRYSDSFANQLKNEGAVVYVHSLSKYESIAPFKAKQIGVYSNKDIR